MGNYNNEGKKNYNKNGNRGGNKNYNNNKKAEIAAKKAETAAKQAASFEVVKAAAEYFNNEVKNGTEDKIKMPALIEVLSQKGFTPENMKFVSQLNYIMLDLANAQKNKHTSDYGKEIRVRYLVERLYTVFYAIVDQIDDAILEYSSLFNFPGMDIASTEEETPSKEE